jgi:cyclophilin family peptidyl-prolyl cis-trans isomerase
VRIEGLSNTRGTLAYAFKDPNGRTTQIFINLMNNGPTHDAEPFVPFAKVTEGMAAADAIYSGYGEQAGGGAAPSDDADDSIVHGRRIADAGIGGTF